MHAIQLIPLGPICVHGIEYIVEEGEAMKDISWRCICSSYFLGI